MQKKNGFSFITCLPFYFLSVPQDKDLDCKLDELKRTDRALSEPQVCEWLCQLLLGVHYIHQR